LKMNFTKFTIAVVALLGIMLSCALSVQPAFAVTGSTNPNDHLKTVQYSSNGMLITELWYRAIPNACSLKDRLIARITLSSCQFTVYVCNGGTCYKTYNKNACTDFVKTVVKNFYQQMWTYVIVSALVTGGGYIIVTFPAWGPILIAAL
jgi:hypothetical protein